MSQKTIMTGIDKAARAPAESRSARRSGPLPDMVDRLLRPRQQLLEPPLRAANSSASIPSLEAVDRVGFPGPA